MNDKCTCPECGTKFDPDKHRHELITHLEEKTDHTCYNGASFTWMGEYEMYVHLPRDGLCTTTVEARQLPEGWYIATTWCNSDETVVSLKLSESFK